MNTNSRRSLSVTVFCATVLVGALLVPTASKAQFGNTATGDSTLYYNTGSYNTADGYYALNINTIGNYNTATGSYALSNNEGGSFNTATGWSSLYWNTGHYNTATGAWSLGNNTTGGYNTAYGVYALGF